MFGEVFFESFPEWKDDEVSELLFAMTANKTTNKGSYLRQMVFWTKVVKKALKASGSAFQGTITPKFPYLFERNGCVPLCLEDVFEYMESIGEIRTTPEKGFVARSFYTLKRLLWKAPPEEDVLVSGRRVFLAADFNNAGKRLAEQMLQKNELCLSEDVLEEAVQNGYTPDDAKLLLGFMKASCEGVDDDGFIFKTTTSGSQYAHIGHLERQRRRVMQEIESVEKGEAGCVEAIRRFIGEKNRTRAGLELRRKKRLEETSKKLYVVLGNIERMQDASRSVEMHLEMKRSLQETNKAFEKQQGIAVDLMQESEKASVLLEEVEETSQELTEALSVPEDENLEAELLLFEQDLAQEGARPQERTEPTPKDEVEKLLEQLKM